MLCHEYWSFLSLTHESHVFCLHLWNYNRVTCQLVSRVKNQTLHSSWHGVHKIRLFLALKGNINLLRYDNVWIYIIIKLWFVYNQIHKATSSNTKGERFISQVLESVIMKKNCGISLHHKSKYFMPYNPHSWSCFLNGALII